VNSVVVGLWVFLGADLLVVSVLSFFVIGRHLPDRGGAPLAGARVPFFGSAHAEQLREARGRLENSNRSIVPWAVVFYSLRAFPWLLGLSLVLTLVAVAR